MMKRFFCFGVCVMIAITTLPGCRAAADTKPSAGPDQPAIAANADVIYVRAVQDADQSWTFYVTVRHPDTGWINYADGWDVVCPDATVIKTAQSRKYTRDLLHPHVDEQPFTRSASGIIIPPNVTQVRVRAHDAVDGFGGAEVDVNLTETAGPKFKVER